MLCMIMRGVFLISSLSLPVEGWKMYCIGMPKECLSCSSDPVLYVWSSGVIGQYCLGSADLSETNRTDPVWASYRSPLIGRFGYPA